MILALLKLPLPRVKKSFLKPNQLILKYFSETRMRKRHSARDSQLATTRIPCGARRNKSAPIRFACHPTAPTKTPWFHPIPAFGSNECSETEKIEPASSEVLWRDSSWHQTNRLSFDKSNQRFDWREKPVRRFLEIFLLTSQESGCINPCFYN